METSTIIYILVAILILVIIIYYYWYIIKDDENGKKDVPYKLLYEQEKTIVDLMRDIADKYGRYPALKKKIKNKWKTTSYSEYHQISNNFAERLLYFIGPHSRVAILSFNRPEWFYAHMGTLISGGVSVGIYPTASSTNCAFITNHSHIDLLIIEDLKQLVKFVGVKMPTVKTILILDSKDIFSSESSEKNNIVESIIDVNPMINVFEYDLFVNQPLGSGSMNTVIEIRKPYPEDIATVIYTSGTTGDPKGVVITHKNIISSIKAGLNAIQTRSNINISIQESFISYLPLNHVAAQMMDIYFPLASVGVVYFTDKDALKGSLLETMKEIKPTVFVGVPRIWEKIYEKIKERKEDPKRLMNKLFVNKMIINEIGLDKAKICMTVAAPISDKIRIFFKDLGIELCDVYGMTETTGPISIGVPGCCQGVGSPVIDVKIDQETNEITVKGDMVFKEYYKNKLATTEAFTSKGWFKTGDTGYIDRSGYLYVTGRIKDIIITAGGENISPIPIEDELLANLNKDNKYFEHAILIGDQRKFLSVLLIPPKNSDLLSDNSINRAIELTNKKAPNNTSTIKKFIVLNSDTTEKQEILTPTLKLRRKYINDIFKNQIDRLYDSIND